MQPIIMVVLIGMVGGIFVALQASLAGIISERLGLIENAYLVFGGGFVFCLVLLLFVGGGNIRNWRTKPWYVFLAGPMGIAIIIAIAGNWQPTRMLVATLIFAFLDALQFTLQGVGTDIPFQLMLAMPYIIALLALMSSRVRSRMPGALGEPYVQG